MDGNLIFYPNIIFTGDQADDFHIIEQMPSGELGGKNSAHFNFFVKYILLVADFFAGKQKKKYGIRWKGKLEDIDSVMIQF